MCLSAKFSMDFQCMYGLKSFMVKMSSISLLKAFDASHVLCCNPKKYLLLRVDSTFLSCERQIG